MPEPSARDDALRALYLALVRELGLALADADPIGAAARSAESDAVYEPEAARIARRLLQGDVRTSAGARAIVEDVLGEERGDADLLGALVAHVFERVCREAP